MVPLRTLAATALLLACTTLTFAEQPAGEPAKDKTVSLREVTQALSSELEQALKENKPLPRDKSDYAQAADVELSERDLMNGLTRPADRNPIVDSYIKWQLLSFKPDFEKMSPLELVRVIDALPPRQVAGQMDRRDMMVVKAAAARHSGDIAVIQKILERFDEQQKQIDQLNKPNDAYRKAVLSAANASSDKGIGLIAQVKNLEQMIDSGEDRQASSLGKKITEELKTLRTDPALNVRMRGELSRRIAMVSRHKQVVVGSFAVKASGDVGFSEKTVGLSSQYVEEMQAYLAGREYTPSKKK